MAQKGPQLDGFRPAALLLTAAATAAASAVAATYWWRCCQREAASQEAKRQAAAEEAATIALAEGLLWPLHRDSFSAAAAQAAAALAAASGAALLEGAESWADWSRSIGWGNGASPARAAAVAEATLLIKGISAEGLERMAWIAVGIAGHYGAPPSHSAFLAGLSEEARQRLVDSPRGAAADGGRPPSAPLLETPPPDNLHRLPRKSISRATAPLPGREQVADVEGAVATTTQSSRRRVVSDQGGNSANVGRGTARRKCDMRRQSELTSAAEDLLRSTAQTLSGGGLPRTPEPFSDLSSPGVASVYCALVQQTRDGCELYIKDFPELAGCSFSEARRRLPDAVLYGWAA